MREQLLVLFSTSIYIVVIGIEVILSHLSLKKYYTLRDTLINVLLCALNIGIDLGFRVVYVAVLTWGFSYQIVSFINHPFIYWFVLFILVDLVFYIEHRVDHYCRIFWAVHVTHHSSEEFNLSTGFRSSVFQPLYRFIYFIPLTIIGFVPIDIMFMFSLAQIYGILVHTRYVQNMPAWFEMLFVSPSHHRVHHASNIFYLDRNMGMVLIIWDKLFGTFQEEIPGEKVTYGLKDALPEHAHAGKVIFHEWVSLWKDIQKPTTWKNRLKYLFMPPGWSHDGSTQTARELRKMYYPKQRSVKHRSRMKLELDR